MVFKIECFNKEIFFDKWFQWYMLEMLKGNKYNDSIRFRELLTAIGCGENLNALC